MTPTPPVPNWFTRLFARYVAAWGQPADLDKLQAYWSVLHSLPDHTILAAADTLMQQGGDYPKSSGDWFQAAAALDRSEKLHAALIPAREEPWHVECPRCDDTGFRPVQAPPLNPADGPFLQPWQLANMTPATRQRLEDTYGKGHPIPTVHTPPTVARVQPCPCRPSNATYQRKREHERLRRQATLDSSRSRRTP